MTENPTDVTIDLRSDDSEGQQLPEIGLDESRVRQIVRETVQDTVKEEVQRAFAKDPAMKRGAIVASKGTLDWAYPPLILGNAAAAVGMETSIFFTFYGLNIIHKDHAKRLKMSAVGNPAMPMPVPGTMPDLITSLPGMIPFATKMMKSTFAEHNVASISELLSTAQEMGIRLIACQMTVDVFGFEQSDFIDGVEFGGAAAFMAQARKSHMTMFI